MTALLFENLKLILLFAWIGLTIALDRFGRRAPARKLRRHGRTLARV